MVHGPWSVDRTDSGRPEVAKTNTQKVTNYCFKEFPDKYSGQNPDVRTNSGHLPDTFRTHSGHIPDTFRTHSGRIPDVQTNSGHILDTFRTHSGCPDVRNSHTNFLQGSCKNPTRIPQESHKGLREIHISPQVLVGKSGFLAGSLQDSLWGKCVYLLALGAAKSSRRLPCPSMFARSKCVFKNKQSTSLSD